MTNTENFKMKRGISISSNNLHTSLDSSTFGMKQNFMNKGCTSTLQLYVCNYTYIKYIMHNYNNMSHYNCKIDVNLSSALLFILFIFLLLPLHFSSQVLKIAPPLILPPLSSVILYPFPFYF